MNNYIILSEKKWHISLFENLKKQFSKDNWFLISSKAEFNFDRINDINPTKIFIPHWSFIISEKFFKNYECIVFHMTDLPFGRGGSPLQNLIIRGIEETKMSALRVEKGIDTGDIYLKRKLSLYGSAQEIFIRSNSIIEKMIIEIIEQNILPKPQEGDVTVFKRRNPDDGNIANLKDLDQVYDYIRMLDADGYPNAFLELDNFRLEFSRVKKETNEILISDVRIIKK